MPDFEFPASDREWIEPYLPCPVPWVTKHRPFVTLTYASSLDAALTLVPGQQTWLSGPQSTAMTHYLRSKHDAILVGVGTAIAANPSLNCRLADTENSQLQPVIIDPSGRWHMDQSSSVIRAYENGNGKAPWIVTSTEPSRHNRELLDRIGGRFLIMERTDERGQISWTEIMAALHRQCIRSVMVEGGANVINSLLSPENKHLLDSVIVCIAPMWFGHGSASAIPSRDGVTSTNTLARLHDIKWHQLGDDAILCALVN